MTTIISLDRYVAEIDVPDDVDENTPVTGSGFEKLTVKDVEPIGDCSLTPGDASPVGRCPNSGALVYLDRPIDRKRNAANEMFEALCLAEEFIGNNPKNDPGDGTLGVIRKALKLARYGR